ncbi:hypothetical protein GOODEAATRI_003643 [Goodea atripinnis]|uniref:PH domain-containing protein n=1 Tax=Goodea atripinnis TaxID=208336 RepID=A0ABV0PKK1_9TELE
MLSSQVLVRCVVLQVSCLGVEPSVDGDDARFVLTSRNPDGSVVRYQLQGSSGEICRGWVNDVYQRRENKSNSLGRSMRPPLSAASASRPHSSASIDRHKLPSLHSHNTSLPALYLPSQSQGASEMFSLRGVGIFSCVPLWTTVPLPLWSSLALLTPTLLHHHMSDWVSLIGQTVQLYQMGCTPRPHRVHR